jgi:hypothetical protein
MANTRGFEVVAQVTVGVLRTIYRDAWKNGGDGSGPGTIPQRVSLGPPLSMGPYAVRDGEVVIPEAGLGLDMAPDINGVEARLTANVSVEIENPPVPSASLFNLVADLVIRVPVGVLDPARNTVGLQLSGLPANAIRATITSGDPIGPITNAAVSEYVHAQYADPGSGFPKLIDGVPLAFPPFAMTASLEIFDDPGDPARRITVAGPTAGQVTLQMPCRLRFYDITGEAYGQTLDSPMAAEATILLVAAYETPPNEVVARVSTATATLVDLIAAPGLEGQNYDANRTLIGLHPLYTENSLGEAIVAGFGPLAQTQLRALGDIRVSVPSVPQIEAFIAEQLRAELELRQSIAVWTPEAPEGSDVSISDVTPKALPNALALCINAGPGANADAVTNLIPANRDFCVAISASKVNAAIQDAINDEFPGGFPHRYSNIEGHDADLNSLSISLRDDDRIRMSGNVTVIDAICKTDVSADFEAHVDLKWVDAADGGQKIVPFQEGDPDIDLSVWVYIVSFLIGFIVLGIIGVIIVAVVVVVAENIAEAVGSRVVDDEVGSQFKSISAWPQTLDGICTVEARFDEAVDIDSGGILSSGSMLITATNALTSVDQANARGPYFASGGAPFGLDGGLDRPSSAPRWAFGDGFSKLERRPVHTYGQSGLYVAKLGIDVQETGGALTRNFAAVTVANVPPVVSAPAVIEVEEGETFELVAAFTDAEWLDKHTCSVDWGDNHKPDVADVEEVNDPPEAKGIVRARHAYCRSGSFRIVVTVQDEHGGTGRAFVEARVRNVAPVVQLPERVRTLVGQPIRLVGRFSDKGWCDRHTANWTFGDCRHQWAIVRQSHEPPEGRGTAEAVHVYENCGEHVARLTVRDDDGAEGTAEMRVEAVRLVNPSFEEGFHRRTGDGDRRAAEQIVANGWVPFRAAWPVADKGLAAAGRDAGFNPDQFMVAGGRRGQAVAARGSTVAGILQRVAVNRGWAYELEAWCDLPEAAPGFAMIGIDPTGGVDPLSFDIVWAERSGAHDWTSIAERVEATGDAITVFLGLRSASADATAIRWDRADLRQIQPFCRAEEPDCTPVHVAMADLVQKRLAEVEVLSGLSIAPVGAALPIIMAGRGQRSVRFGKDGLSLTAPAAIREMRLDLFADTRLNVELSVFTGKGLVRQTIESLPAGRTETVVRQEGLIRLGLRATAEEAFLVAAALCLPTAGTPERPAKQICATFDVLSDGYETRQPVTISGFEFIPAKGGLLRVSSWGAPQGTRKLVFPPAGMKIVFPFPAARVTAEFGLYAGDLVVDAFAGDARVSGTTVPAGNGIVPFVLEGSGLTALEITGGGNEAFLARICITDRVAKGASDIAAAAARPDGPVSVAAKASPAVASRLSRIRGPGK